MGVPRVMQRTIELPGVGNVAGAMVNVGNPHFVLFVDTDDFSAHGHAWQELGAKISTSPLFPHGTNVEFVRVLSPSEIAFRIYERGCGPTTSSGTGTCASSAAAMALRSTERELTAVAEGGAQRTVWPGSDAVMRLTGPAEIICRGEVLAL
jgi:diaminopimelate epimerase